MSEQKKREFTLSRQTLIFVLIGAVMVEALVLSANGTVGRLANNLFEFGRKERNDLNAQLALARDRLKVIQLEPLTAKQKELEQQLAQNTDRMDQVRSMLEQPINKTDVIGVLFETAKAHNLEVTRMSLSGLADDQLVEVAAYSTKLLITVEGDVLDLVAFTSELNTLYTYGVVDSAQIENPEPEGGTAHADVSLTLYTVQSK